MTKQKTTTTDYLTRLAEAAPSFPTSIAPGMDGGEPPPSDIPVPQAPPGGQISPMRLAQVFTSSIDERERVATAFRRILSGQHLTLEYRIILTDQLVKVLQAAQQSEAQFMHLKMLLNSDEPETADGSLREALSPKASSALFRLSRLLSPEHSTLLRNALGLIGDNKPIDRRRVGMIVDAFGVLLSVFEEHPELIQTVATKARDVNTIAPPHPEPGGAPAVGLRPQGA